MSWTSARSSANELVNRLRSFEANHGVASDGAAKDNRHDVPRPRPRAAVKDTACTAEPSKMSVAAEPAHSLSIAPAIAQTDSENSAEEADRLLARTPASSGPDPAGQARVELKQDAEPSGAEHRRSARKVQSIAGYVTAPGMSSIIPARVIDISVSGARIELTPLGRASGVPISQLPEQFIFVFRHDRIEVDCELVWQKDWIIGVRFLSASRPTRERR